MNKQIKTLKNVISGTFTRTIIRKNTKMGMNLSGVRFSGQKVQQNRNNVAFGYKVYVDTGASDPVRGSFKVRIASDDSKKVLISTEQLPESMQKVGLPEGFKDGRDYVSGLSNNIIKSIEMAKDKISTLGEKLTGVVINAPTYIKDNFSGKVSNIVNAENVDFNEITTDLKKAGIQISDKSYRLIALNDLAGAAAGIARMMATNPQYKDEIKDGFFGSIWMTGGGTGIADIKVKNGYLEIETSESGHNPALGSKKSRTVEKEGGSSPALIRNYCKAIGLNKEDTEKLMKIGKAKLTSNYPLKVDTGSDLERDLLDTGLFTKREEIIDKKGRNRSILKMNGVGRKEHNKASKAAINKYIDTLAQMSANKILEGVNSVILTGPLALKVIESVNKNPGLWECKSFEEIAMERTRSLLDESSQKLIDAHNFNFIYDLEVPDNTVGGELLLNEGTNIIGKGVRGNWINIPVNNLTK